MNGDLIEQFVDNDALEALRRLVGTNAADEAVQGAVTLAGVFNTGADFAHIADPATDGEAKLISSFYHNLVLLIQKTWVEKSDEDLKAQVLYHLDDFTRLLQEHSYAAAYAVFLGIVSDVVYLMFGAQSRNKDFDEYALRIDPEFGIFWWYMQALPREMDWQQEKTRVAILLGMYFLANY